MYNYTAVKISLKISELLTDTLMDKGVDQKGSESFGNLIFDALADGLTNRKKEELQIILEDLELLVERYNLT